MPTIIVAALLVFTVVGSYLLFATIAKSEKRKRMNKILLRLSELGSKYDMTFSCHELLKSCVIGLDGINRKLLLLSGINNAEYKASVVDLADVKCCSVKKQYGIIKRGVLDEKELQNNLELIVLQFEFKDGKQPVAVPFYQYLENNIGKIKELEQKARDWETVLSKLLTIPSNYEI